MPEPKPRAKRGPKPKPPAAKLRNEVRIYVSDFIYRELDQASRDSQLSISEVLRAQLEERYNPTGGVVTSCEPLYEMWIDAISERLSAEWERVYRLFVSDVGLGEDEAYERVDAIVRDSVLSCFDVRMTFEATEADVKRSLQAVQRA